MRWALFRQGRFRSLFLGLVLAGVCLTRVEARPAGVNASSSTIHSIEFEGAHALPADQLLKRLPLHAHQTLTPDNVRLAIGTIEGVYRDAGYADVRVSTSTLQDPVRGLQLTFRIDEGPKYHIQSIRIEGNRFISERTIRRQIDLKIGDPYSQTRLYDADKALYMGGYFQTIDIHTSSAPAHGMDVLFQVKERPTQFLKGGVGYGAETKERVSLGYENRNFLGNARRLDVDGVYSGFLTNPDKYETKLIQVSLAQPNIFNTVYEAQTTLAQEWDNREAYDSKNSTWKTTVGRKFGHSITANLQYRYQGTRITHINPEEASVTPGFTNISAIGPNFTYDNTNDPFLPSNGWRIMGSVEKGMSMWIGTLPFIKLMSRVGRFDTVHDVTFFEGIQMAVERPDDPSDVMPIFERYFLGGANTVRGYEERELGPRDNLDAPVGGEAFGVVNLEVRKRLYKKIYGVTFLDGGQLWQRPAASAWPYVRAEQFNDLAYGTGLGLRFHTPVGAVRLEAGYKLNPSGDNPGSFWQRTTIHFSLGEVF
jgi:outer membrane protein insertion porin family